MASTHTPPDPIEHDIDTKRALALAQCAAGDFPELWYKFKRFEFLSLLNLYHYQDELVRINRTITREGKFTTKTQLLEFRTLLKDYHEAVLRFRDISQMKRPEMKDRKKAVKVLSNLLGESYYETASDAFGLLDLTPAVLGVEPDLVRNLVTAVVPKNLYKYSHIRHRPTHHYGPLVERLSRLAIATATGVFLIIPMIVLSFVKQKWVRLLSASIFIVFFAGVTATWSKANNQELIMCTAAYAAVIVVFVGQTS